MGWMVRHCAWIFDRLQIKSDGRTACRRMRDKDYELAQTGEICIFRNHDADETQLELRWNKGKFIGRSGDTDELVHSVDTPWSTDDPSGETIFLERFLGQGIIDNLRW